MSQSPARPDARAQIAGLTFSVLLLDESLIVAEANPAAEELLGRSLRRIEGSPLFALITFEDELLCKRLSDGDAQLTARGAEIGIAERRIVGDLTVSPLPTHPGWRVLTLAEIGHVSAHREEEGESSLRAPGVLAHEIKNPLAAIKGAGQLLARKSDLESKSLTTLIVGEVDRIARLIDRMQTLGSRTAEPLVAFNPHEAVRSAIATLRAGGAQGMEIREQFDPSLPPVLANCDALGQVLVNLIANACDACREIEEPLVTIRTRYAGGSVSTTLADGRAVRLPVEIVVSDNGPGVEPEVRAHIFEPFVTSKPNGQGLGLALARKLVRDMGGRIAHERNENAGVTCFRINLPVAQ